ncbi:MAG: 1-acyl-sn-glycerol-3-phosphate acyltransferase [Cytophagaceae bacterium]|jgi:1-acyl-sn-glycerol-3-phosphate acyltransferase|nr:1-acyl-sn-glycerol-3-phosphate acyltransferase [Cytophagaceae bacterium]
MKAFRIFYTLLAAVAFFLFFFLIFPFFWLFIQKESWKPYGHFLNKLWAYLVFGVCFLPTQVVHQFRPSRRKSYVYCANHSSYLDIPSLAYALPGYFMFIGKASLAKLPMFGYMFRNLYIPVNRESSKSKHETLKRSMEAIRKGRSVAYFPEGTIPKHANPTMIPFKDGAFRVAIETQVPIVPVTICYNWIIFPDKSPRLITRHLMKVVIHKPISTEGLSLDDVESLKAQTYRVIEEELTKHQVR